MVSGGGGVWTGKVLYIHENLRIVAASQGGGVVDASNSSTGEQAGNLSTRLLRVREFWVPKTTQFTDAVLRTLYVLYPLPASPD